MASAEGDAPFRMVLQRLCNAESDEDREVYAMRLCAAVETFGRAHVRARHESAVRSLTEDLLTMLCSNKVVNQLACIAAFKAMIGMDGDEGGVTRIESALRYFRGKHSPDTDKRLLVAYCELLERYADEPGYSVRRSLEVILNRSFERLLSFDRASLPPGDDCSRYFCDSVVVSKLCARFPGVVRAQGTYTVLTVCRLVALRITPVYQDHLVECLSSVLRACFSDQRGVESNQPFMYAFDTAVDFVRERLSPYTAIAEHIPEAEVSSVAGTLAIMGALGGVLGSISVHEGAESVSNQLEASCTEFCQLIQAFCRSPDEVVQRAVSSVALVLAKADKDVFSSSNTAEVVVNAFERRSRSAASQPLRTEALEALGLLAETLKAEGFESFLEKSLCLCNDLLSEVLRTTDAGTHGHSVAPVLSLVAKVLSVTKKGDERYLEMSWMLIAKLFQTGFCESLIDALKALIVIDESKEPYVENIVIRKLEKLLQSASKGSPNGERSHPSSSFDMAGRRIPVDPSEALFYVRPPDGTQLGFVSALAQQRDNDFARVADLVCSPHREGDGMQVASGSSDEVRSGQATFQVALLTLAKFKFSIIPPVRLAWFANQFVVKYLDSSRLKDRQLAAKACGNLMRCAVSIERPNSRLRDETLMMLSQLVSVAVVDPCRTVRLVVLDELKSKNLGRYLGQEDVLRRLSLCLNDEDFEVRRSALSLFCEVYHGNPSVGEVAIIIFLKRICALLRCPPGTADFADPFAGLKMQATQLLLELLQSSARSFILRYDENIISILVALLRDRLSNLANIDMNATVPILEAFGPLAAQVTTILDPYAEELIPLLVSAVLEFDATSCQCEFRIATLRALARVTQNTCLSVKPYESDERLFSNLIASLKSETNEAVRVETVALLGAVGARNPDHFRNLSLLSLPANPLAPPRSSQDLSAEGETVGPRIRRGEASQRTSGGAYSVAESATTSKFGSARCNVEISHRDSPAAPAQFMVADTPPPRFRNAARGVDFNWLRDQMYNKKALWQQGSLRTDSLVSLLPHPYSASKYYFPSLALDVLHQIIGQAKFVHQYPGAVVSIVDVIMYVKSINQCDYFLKSVIPRLLWLLRPMPSEKAREPVSGTTANMFTQFARLVRIVKEDIKPYMLDTISLCYAYLVEEDAKYREPAIAPVCDLLHALAGELGNDFRAYALHVMGPLMSAVIRCSPGNYHVVSSVLQGLRGFGQLYADYANIVLPCVALVYEDVKFPTRVREEALTTAAILVRHFSPVDDLASGLMQSLVRVLASAAQPGPSRNVSGSGVAKFAARAIREVASCCPSEFLVFVPIVSKALLENRALQSTPEYCGLESVLLQSNAVVFSQVTGDVYNLEECSHRIRHLEQRYSECQPWSAFVATSSNFYPVQDSNGFQHAPDMAQLLAVFRESTNETSALGWNQWMDRVTAALVAQSSSYAIRALQHLGFGLSWVFRSVFNAAFLSCWQTGEDGANYCIAIVDVLENALKSESIPLNVKQAVLGLVEFMDHAEAPITVDPDLLARAAVDVGAFAKAIRYRESQYVHPGNVNDLEESRDFLKGVLSDPLSGLLSLYCQLGDNVTVGGMLDHFESIFGASEAEEVRKRCYPNQMFCAEALDVYRESLARLPPHVDFSLVHLHSDHKGKALFQAGYCGSSCDDARSLVVPTLPGFESDYGKGAGFDSASADADLKWYLTLSEMRTLDHLGEWGEMEHRAKSLWSDLEDNHQARSILAVDGRAASVAFDLCKLDEFEERALAISEERSWPRHFYRSLVCVHKSLEDGHRTEMLGEACRHIVAARKTLDTALTSRVAEGYPRAYDQFLDAQHLVEMEEMLACSEEEGASWFQGVSRPRRSGEARRLQALWNARQKEARQDHNTWYRLLMTRSLLFKPIESKSLWLKFVSKCRKEERLPMATEALRRLVEGSLTKLTDSNEHVADRASVMRLLQDSTGRVPSVETWSADSLLAIPDTAVAFACVKHLWGSKKDVEAFSILRTICADDVLETRGLRSVDFTEKFSEETCHLCGEMYLKLAKWSERMSTQHPEVTSVDDTFRYSWRATQWQPAWYKAWHFWATLNLFQAEKLEEDLEEEIAVGSKRNGLHQSGMQARSVTSCGSKPGTSRLGRHHWNYDATVTRITKPIQVHLTNAVDGYFMAIQSSGKTSLEDVLTLLRLWFKYGSDSSLNELFSHGLEKSSPDCWLDVVPQIIARLHSQHEIVRTGIERLLTRIGLAHPHAAVYPLTVASRSPGKTSAQENRRLSASKILAAMKAEHKEIVQEAGDVATELNRVAILDQERWYDCIEEASRLFYTERDVSAMVESLRHLHERMDSEEAVTDCEKKFRELYGDSLNRAYKFGKAFDAVNQELAEKCARLSKMELESIEHVTHVQAVKEQQQARIGRAWEHYYEVFRLIQKEQQQGSNKLHLPNVSPKLNAMKDMSIVIPGSYVPGSSKQVRISLFEEHLDIMQSKQRPRKLHIVGDDGVRYGFLLKGQDDLRQDERVMQVFGLMNKHLEQSEDRSVRQGAQLKLYDVIVLSSNAGLIRWIPDCDTMYSLVKGFREDRLQIANVEHRIMTRNRPDLESLPLMHRVDVFQSMQESTDGGDIERILWLSSSNSEIWLERRTNFARTLATTSMAGYMLGLGDRHPSNIMIARYTGRVMHIDFGDCFEVAMRRDKYPEKVPFRLTRMLVHGLGPCGVRGLFRHTAVAFLNVLRQDNTRTALLTMMEAFVFDPLIRTKLLDGAELTEMDRRDGRARKPPPPASALHIVPTRHVAHIISDADGASRASAGDVHHKSQLLGRRPSQLTRSRLQSYMLRNGGSISQRYADLANRHANEAIYRVMEKLDGLDFEDVRGNEPLEPHTQVDRLVDEAQEELYLCQLFPGWVASW